MAAPTDPTDPTRHIIEEVANWQAQLADEACGEGDHAAFREWMAADPSHRLACGRFAIPAILLLGTVLGSVWWGAGETDVRTRLVDARTAIGEQARVELAAGDRITLDSESAADLAEDSREVRLWQGGLMA